MEPEEKRKALEWLGYRVYRKNYLHSAIWYYGDGNQVCLFNPDSPEGPRSVWDEIWERMTEDEFDLYCSKIWEKYNKLNEKTKGNYIYYFHTVHLDICTDAWLKTIGIR